MLTKWTLSSVHLSRLLILFHCNFTTLGEKLICIATFQFCILFHTLMCASPPTCMLNSFASFFPYRNHQLYYQFLIWMLSQLICMHTEICPHVHTIFVSWFRTFMMSACSTLISYTPCSISNLCESSIKLIGENPAHSILFGFHNSC